MKKIKCLILPMILALVISCEKENNLNESFVKQEKLEETVRYNAQDFNFVGEVHNEELEATFNYISSEINDIHSQEQLLLKIDNFYTQLLLNMEYGENFTDFIANENFVYLEELQYIDFSNKELGEQTKFILNTIRTYLNELEDAVDNASISDIEKVEREIYRDKDITNKELFVFYSISSVAKSSLEYWYENNLKWIQLILEVKNKEQEMEVNNENPKKVIKSWPPKRDWGLRVAKQDAMGAGAGAAYAWWMNAAPGAGQLAYGTAIGATSASFSAAALIDELWPWGYNIRIEDIPPFSTIQLK